MEANIVNLPLKYNNEEFLLTTEPSGWQMWCRLCAKDDPDGNVQVLFQNDHPGHGTTNSSEENVTDTEGEDVDYFYLPDLIERYFCVQLRSDDTLPTILCTDCVSLITSLVNFSERVAKVQQMFLALEKSCDSLELDAHSIRQQYGLLDKECSNIFIHKPMPEVHFLETTLNIKSQEEYKPDEVLMANPLEPSINIKIKTENTPTNIQSEDNEHDSYNDIGESINNEEDFLNTNEASESSDNEQLNDVIVSDTIKKESDESCDKLLVCPECQRQYKGVQGLKRHMIRQHSKKLTIEVPCSQCPRTFKSQYKLDKHLATHLPGHEPKKYPCLYCDMEFTTRHNRKVHVKHEHKDRRPFICEYCGAGKQTRCALKEHMVIHLDYAPHKCNICGRGFKLKKPLERHMGIHFPKKHVCPICGMLLSSRGNLREHLAVHSDVKRHECDYCGRAFKRSCNLKSHLVSHTGIKPYACNYCDRVFSCSANCRMHVKKIHPEKASIGGTVYTLKMPKLEVLKEISKTADNLAPVPIGPVSKAEVSKIKIDLLD